MRAFTVGSSCSALTAALVKNDEKPSFTPCFFSKASLYCCRRAITALMSHSLKVVSMAAVRSEEHTSELQSLMRISYAVFCLNKNRRITHKRIREQASTILTHKLAYYT